MLQNIGGVIMNASKLTESVLCTLSSHLSGRSEYRNTEYIVNITEDSISFYPYVKVFPNKYRRRPEDKDSVLYHVMYYHFYDILRYEVDGVTDKVLINSNMLVPGKYVYTSSFDKKRRKWIKCLNSLDESLKHV